MDNNFNNKFAWNDSMILDKIEEILDGKKIDDLELTEDELNNIKAQLNDALSEEELKESACLLAENIDELKDLPKYDKKEYISNLINYLNYNNLNCIIGECNGIEFEVYKNATVDEVFKDYYSRYDEIYGISDMLSDLGLK